MLRLNALMTAAAHWLGSGAVDGTLFAVAVWLVSLTLLRGSTGRVMAAIWLAAMVSFVVVRPFHMSALPLGASMPLSGGTASAPLAQSYGWVPLVYGLTVALLLARMVVRQQRLRRRIATLALAEPAIIRCVRAAADALVLPVIPEVRTTEAHAAPFTVGPSRPTLVLPRWLCVPGRRLDAVLLHELAHLERHDHWSLWLEHLVSTVFFFWPPVHWVRRKLDEARELACDERAIQRGAFASTEYGRHLVEVVSVTRGRSLVAGALAMSRGYERLGRRIDHLLQEPWAKGASWRAGAALAVLAACWFVGLGARPERDPPLSMPVISTPAIAGCEGSATILAPPETPALTCGSPR